MDTLLASVLLVLYVLVTTATVWLVRNRRRNRFLEFVSVRRDTDSLQWRHDLGLATVGANGFLVERDPELLSEAKRRKFLDKKLLLPLYLDTDLVSALYQQAETPFRLTKLVEERSNQGTADLALQVPPLKAGVTAAKATRSVAEYEGSPTAPYAQFAAVLRYSIRDITFGVEDQAPPRLDDDFNGNLKDLLAGRGLDLSEDVIATIRAGTEAKQTVAFEERLMKTSGFVAVHGKWDVGGDGESGPLTMSLRIGQADARITTRLDASKLLSGARGFIGPGQRPEAWVVGWALGDADKDQSLGLMAVAVIA